MTIDGVLAGYHAILHFPHPTVKNMKRSHRLIIHPQFQGMGFGEYLCSYVGKYYYEQGWRFRITTSHPGLVYRNMNSPNWDFVYKKDQKGEYDNSTIKGRMSAGNRTTYTFEYKQD